MKKRQFTLIELLVVIAIIAILAAMRGASPVTGIEIDEAAYVNALENIRLNRQPQINIVLGDAARLADVEPADVFIANINRNIILADIEAYAARLKAHGTMLLSGFYESDVEILLNSAKPLGLSYISHDKKDDWTCLRLQKA